MKISELLELLILLEQLGDLPEKLNALLDKIQDIEYISIKFAKNNRH